MTQHASSFFYYVKGASKGGIWKAVEVNDHERLNAPSVAFRTVLSVNKKVRAGGEAPDPETTLYQGPFYIDVDADNEPGKAIRQARSAVQALMTVGIREQDIYVWHSGSKGFHILVPQEVIAPPGPHLKLPTIYKCFAQDLKLDIDYRVYSQGRGRMWRVAGRRRENGLYKVPLTLDELMQLKVKDYAAICARPRPEPEIQPGVPCKTARARFERAKARALELKTTAVFVDPEMLKALADEEYGLPPCGQIMLHGETRDEVGFNDVSIQFAKVLATFGGKNTDSLLKEFAANSKGDRYATPSARETHCRGALSSAKGYKWSCRSALSVIEGDPCEHCPVSYLRLEQEQKEVPSTVSSGSGLKAFSVSELDELDEVPTINLASLRVSREVGEVVASSRKAVKVEAPSLRHSTVEVEDTDPDPDDDEVDEVAEDPAQEPPQSESFTESHFDLANPYGLIADEDGYGFMVEKGGIRRICNFTIRIIRIYHEWVPAISQYRRTAVMADVYLADKKVGQTLIEEGSWNTKSRFALCFNGMSNLGFFGKDDDPEKLRIVLMAGAEKTAEHVKRVHTFGIHYETVAGTDVFTYVEPGWSIDNFGNENKYSLLGASSLNAPRLKDIEPLADRENYCYGIAEAYLYLNHPLAVAHTLGWTMACFLKAHIATFKREFPLMSVFGNQSSGKTQGMMKLGLLHGVPYDSTADTTSAVNSTPFAIWQALSSSETAPIILDEFNLSKMGRQKYNAVGEQLKESYQRGAVQRGVLSGNRGVTSAFGADIRSFTLSAPVVVLSEQSIVDFPALVNRTLQVHLNPQGLGWNENRPRKAFEYIQENKDRAAVLARHFYMTAINTKVQTVREVYDEWAGKVPLSIGDRPHHAFVVNLLGWWFFRHACAQVGMFFDEQVEQAENLILTLLTKDIEKVVEAKSRSEIDIVLDTMATMAASVSDDTIREALRPEVHYLLTADTLYLDTQLAFAAFRRYMAVVERRTSPISNLQAFKQLVQHEPYYLGEVLVPDFARDTPCVSLSLKGLKDKGIDTSGFLIGETL